MTARPDRPALQAEILRQAEACPPGRSLSPSDIAKALYPENWQSILTPVRQAAVALQREGRLEVLRKGKPVPPAEVRGVIRLRLPATPPTD
ncbi:DUF3253 domain-containing protein [Roseomonas sp. SSH11]|uniref:DUF3253 domain-containing protein n=1 Tax=Pararoseomonas baculiformis TaxID=2820812 RepID=A0ABS4AAC7_9PROT|nr:DUF3253 domain-containing protein [Pararoseomonas baculiformis]MBP0443954.1 DUF3253 domain-containing protein [Pararoseomonas baculiformis]